MSLRAVAWISGLYDLLLGLPLLLAPAAVAALFGAPAPAPVVNAQINGVFALALAFGYFWAARDAEGRRGFLWAAGPFAKGLGSAVFVADHFVRGSPRSFLAFAASDGALAILTAWALLRSRRRQ
jgi:hypothetical protein